jgi:hypothetical protein
VPFCKGTDKVDEGVTEVGVEDDSGVVGVGVGVGVVAAGVEGGTEVVAAAGSGLLLPKETETESLLTCTLTGPSFFAFEAVSSKDGCGGIAGIGGS